ncbi:MAG: hypothetical protein ACI9I4_001168, partial [Neolewinella sp.]
NTSAAITQILVTLCLSVVDVDGDDSGINDVTNPANYLLFSQGSNETFDTQDCANGLANDDIAISIDNVTYDAASRTARLELNAASALTEAPYRLLVCGTTSIENAAGQKLDGNADGAGGRGR